MANKKINELPVRVPSLTDLMIVGDPFTGYSYKSTLTSLSTLISNSLSGTYVPNTRTLTVNGTTYDLSANRSWSVGTVTSIAVSAGTGISVSGSPITSSGTITITNSAPDQVVALTAGTGISISGTYPNFTIVNSLPSLGGTVTSVGLSVPTGLTISGSPITTSGTLALGLQTGYSIPTTASQANWDAAYNDKINSAAVTGTTTKTLTLTQQDGGTVTASWSDLNTDAVTSVFGRTGAVVAASGDYTTAQVTESTNLYYTDARARGSVSAGTGISYSSTTGVIVSTITQYTDALARAAISLTTTGSSGSATYSSLTGVLNVPTYTLAGLGGISLSSLSAASPLSYNSGTGQFSINQANTTTNGFLSSTDWNTFNNKLSAAVTSLNGLTASTQTFATGTSGTDFAISSTTSTHTFNLPTASATNRGALSSADWSTFNGKQSAITLTTTGSSGASTFISNTLNIPTYTLSGLGGEPAITAGTTSQYFRGDKTFQTLNTAAVTESTNLYFTNSRARTAISLTTTGTSGAATYDNTTGVLNIPQYSGGGGSGTVSGTTNYIAKFTSSTAVGNSLMFDTGTGIAIGNGQSSATPQLGLIEGTDGSGTNIAGAEFRIQGGQGTGTGAGGVITFYTSAAGTSGSATNSAVERMRITSTGTVGIGTTTIGSTLQVNGNAAIGYSASTAAPTNGLAVAGNVGIGLSGATQLLTLYAANYPIIRFQNSTSGTTSGVGADIFTDANDMWIRNIQNGLLAISTNNTERFRINASGVAFIGNGETAASPNTGIISGTGGTGTNIAGAEFRIRGGASTGSAAGGPITFYTSAAGTAGTGVNAATEVMRILSTGFVGIGTNNPSELLQVQKNQNATTRISLSNTTSGVNAAAEFGLNSDASAGGAVFGKYSSTRTTYKILNATDGFIYNGTAGDISLLNDFASGNIKFAAGASSTAQMTLNASGNLGINTTTIGSRLQVNGNAAIGYSASTAAPTNGLAVAGNAGFGTTTPGYTAASRQVVAINGGSAAAQGSLLAFMGAGVNKGYVWSYQDNMEVWCESGSLTLGNNAAASIIIKPNNTDRLTVTSGGQVTLATGANVSAIAQTGYSLTGSNASSLLDLAGTWNTTGNPTALKLNITNTASGASAYLMDLQVGGVTQFRVTKAGAIRTTSPSGGTANDWKFGSRFATTVALDTTQYLEVEVGGTFYRVGIVSAL